MALKFNAVTGNLDVVLDKAEEIKVDNTGWMELSGTEVQAALDSVDTLIAALPDPITYKGTWDASTNTPTLSNADVGVTGFLYQVNVAGSVDFGAGSISFEIGDKVVNNGTVWEKWDMTDAVMSVNGQTGVVVLDSDDVAEGVSNLYFTDERAQDAAGGMATSSSKVSLTYNDGAATLTPDIVPGSLVNADVSPTAAIAYGKLNLAGSIVNADISLAAAITYNKLNLGNSIDNTDIATTAAINVTKLSTGVVTNTEFDYLDGVTSPIQTQLNAKVGFTRVTVTVANASVAAGNVVLCNRAGPITITLPSPTDNSFVVIKDISGNAETNNITIITPSGQIDGSATLTLNSNYGSYFLFSDGTNFYAI